MGASDAMLWVAGGMGVLACAAAALAWLLRRCGIPGGRMGGAVLGGIIAGVLLGPGVAGRVAPSTFQRMFVGAVAEQRAVDEMEGRHRRELEVVEATDVTPAYIAELSAKQAVEIAPLVEAAEKARQRRAATLDAVVAGIIAIHLLLVGLVCAPMGRWMRRAWRRHDADAGPLSIGDGVGAAGLMVVVALVTPILALMWILRAPPREAIGVGIAMAAPAVGPEARVRLLPAALIGILASAAVVAYLSWASAPVVMSAVVGGAVGVMVALVLWGRVRIGRAARRGFGWVMAGATLPLVAALAVVRCDPHAMLGSTEFWVVALTAALFSSDGRWVGIGWAQKLFPRGTGRALPGARTWTAASGLVNAGTGMAQLVIGLVLEAAGVISPQALAGLVLGTAAIELSRGVRTRVGWMMDGGREVTK